jgi:hypothetical protein
MRSYDLDLRRLRRCASPSPIRIPDAAASASAQKSATRVEKKTKWTVTRWRFRSRKSTIHSAATPATISAPRLAGMRSWTPPFFVLGSCGALPTGQY